MTYHVTKVNVNVLSSCATVVMGTGVDRASGGETEVVAWVGPYSEDTAPVGAGKVDRETWPVTEYNTGRPNAESALEPEATNVSVGEPGVMVCAVS